MAVMSRNKQGKKTLSPQGASNPSSQNELKDTLKEFIKKRTTSHKTSNNSVNDSSNNSDTPKKGF